MAELRVNELSTSGSSAMAITAVPPRVGSSPGSGSRGALGGAVSWRRK